MCRQNAFDASATTRNAALRILGSLAVVLAASSAVEAATLNVCKSGCAYTTIQAAINAAKAADIVQIGAGTYVENLSITRALTLSGSGEDVTAIDGGFRGPVINALGQGYLTILNLTVTHGGQGGVVASVEGLVTLQGTIIASNRGPGITLNATSALITGSVIAHNISSGAQGAGGIETLGDLGYQAYITIKNSSIVRNTGSTGGISAVENENFIINGSTIADNSSLYQGGGIFIVTKIDKTSPGGSLVLDSSTVENNHAATDGGGICGSAVISNSVIARNTAGHNGGGLSNSDSCGNNQSPTEGVLELTNVTVAGNTAGNLGGGISATNVTTNNVFIVQNAAGSKDGGIVAETLAPNNGTPLVVTSNTPNNCAVVTGGCPNP